MDIFNTPISRKGTYCTQWDFCEDRFGVHDIIPFSISDMDLPIPQAITKALQKRLEHPVLGYSRWQHSEYLNAICHWYGQKYDTVIDANWITYSPSVMYSIAKALELLTVPEDSVLTFTPAYNAFFDVIKNSGRKLLTSTLIKNDDGRYGIDWNDFNARAKHAKVILLCNPHNPTGKVWSEHELIKISEICIKNNCWLLSDEIHSDFAFSHKFTSALKLHYDKTVVFNSISKTFNVPALTGSYLIAPDIIFNEKFRVITRYRDFVNSPSVLNIIATIVAYNECDVWLQQLKSHLQSNIDFAVHYVQENLSPLKLRESEGCYFAWIDCSHISCSFEKFYAMLIHEGKVGIMAGNVYGPGGENYLRLNLACSRKKLYQGLSRVAYVIDKINQENRHE
ncbi:MalY/PatB family protein [Citrobacter freundii]|uniref:MalY/PatB family protein n=2 Tax=Citrobacter freundii TaxID=546 RepID=UPI001902B3A8|nr:PatB family C-S lyase [Citrobacter freundii]MBJ9179468.1 PatB family C-S lyase [Citrobacter freundii]WMY39283.1 PatB family C-S lyase [Citrobacter freundii]HCJ7750244.1 PatB family C-S lyase [Citrobacter freundii]